MRPIKPKVCYGVEGKYYEISLRYLHFIEEKIYLKLDGQMGRQQTTGYQPKEQFEFAMRHGAKKFRPVALMLDESRVVGELVMGFLDEPTLS